MEFNIVTLDMIFALGIKEFSCICPRTNKIEQFNIINDRLHYWDSTSGGWKSYCLDNTLKGYLEKYYHSFFTWEIVNNEV